MFQNNKKMPFIMGAAVVFAIVSNWSYFFNSSKKVNTASAATQVQKAPSVKQVKEPQSPQKPINNKVTGKLPDYQLMAALTKKTDWEKNIFGISAKDKDEPNPVKIVPKEEKTVTRGLRLESIMITQQQLLAVINGRLLTEGDFILGKKVLKITKDAVLVEENGVIEGLKMKEVGIAVKKLAISSGSNKE